jgi:hypothetical protein
MSDQLLTSVVTVVMAIIGVAILAVLVSKNANTSGVIGAASKGLSMDLGAALSPIAGGGFSVGTGLNFNPYQ